MKKIYVGNFPYSTTEDELRELFEQYGTIHSLDLIKDRETGRPRGFGFIEMDEDAANAAIAALNGTELGERTLRVSEARSREESGRRRSDRRGPRRQGPGRRGPRRQEQEHDWDR